MLAIWANWHFSCADQHSKSAEWPSWVPNLRLNFGLIWTPFFRTFEPEIALRHIFNPYSKN